MNPLSFRNHFGQRFGAFYLRFESYWQARNAMGKLKAMLDLWGFKYEIMHLSNGGQGADTHILSVCSANPAVMSLLELTDWHGGELINDIPNMLQIEGGVPSLRYEPGSN